MLKSNVKTDFNQISLTGLRGIVLMGLLIIAPRSFDEIRKAFLDFNIIEETTSDDILRIDLNTLKVMGCEISRSCPKTNYKYVLTKHPFELFINDSEIEALRKTYNKLKNSCDVYKLLEYDDLLRKIADNIKDEEQKQALYGISSIKSYDREFINNLLSDCQQERILNILYKKPTSTKDEEKTIIAKKVEINNNKLYLYGYDMEKQESRVFNIKRIKKILSRKISYNDIKTNSFEIRYHLKTLGIEALTNDEKIISNENGYIVLGSYFNEFYAMQRVLSFGSNCTVLEPIEFRNNVIQKLKEMRNIYEN